MKARRLAPLVSTLVLAALLPSFAKADDDVEAQLKDYAGKTLTLRHFYKGEHLSFQSNGTLVGSAEIGPWTVDGQIEIKHIKRHGRALQIEGRRICVAFDSNRKPPYYDVLDMKNRDRQENLEKIFRKRQVEINVALNSDTPDTHEVTSVMNSVFLGPTESVGDVVPEYWREYFDKLEGRTRSPSDSEKPAGFFKAGKGIAPPRVLNQHEPEFSEEARQAKYQGVITLSLVVDESGYARNLQITTPLGMGLDEKAVAAVGSWKFQPATKDGQPVPVQIAAEVDFHLY